MVMNQFDTEVTLLINSANAIKDEFSEVDQAWENSPFLWIKSLPSSSKGKLGVRLIKQWVALRGLSVDFSPDSESDLLINGHRIEVKLSTRWKSGVYAFQQIRDQNYEYCTCLGISPNTAHCWVIRKDLLLLHVIGHMGQHTGVTASETSWLRFNPEQNNLIWLNQCGGTLRSAFEIINRLTRIRN